MKPTPLTPNKKERIIEFLKQEGILRKEEPLRQAISLQRVLKFMEKEEAREKERVEWLKTQLKDNWERYGYTQIQLEELEKWIDEAFPK